MRDSPAVRSSEALPSCAARSTAPIYSRYAAIRFSGRLAVPEGAGRVLKCGAPRSSMPMNRMAFSPSSQQTASTRAAATPGINSRWSSRSPLEAGRGSPAFNSSVVRILSGASFRSP